MSSRVNSSAPNAESDDRVDEVLDLLRESGGRVTTSRRILLRCLFDDESPHRTAEELAEQVQRVAPDVHISTIYRNLEELERLGIVVHAHLGHGPATYHLSSDTHGHLVCENCAMAFEAPEDIFEELAATALRDFHFVIDPRHFAVLGRCAGCVNADAT